MALVWYSSWQMECCGEPFRVGDTVDWSLVADPDVDWLEAAIGAELASKITHQEDHHDVDGEAGAHHGRVKSIRCAYSAYAPSGGDQRTLYPVAGTTEIVPTDRVDGTENTGSSRHFNGYVVELELDAAE